MTFGLLWNLFFWLFQWPQALWIHGWSFVTTLGGWRVCVCVHSCLAHEDVNTDVSVSESFCTVCVFLCLHVREKKRCVHVLSECVFAGNRAAAHGVPGLLQLIGNVDCWVSVRALIRGLSLKLRGLYWSKFKSQATKIVSVCEDHLKESVCVVKDTRVSSRDGAEPFKYVLQSGNHLVKRPILQWLFNGFQPCPQKPPCLKIASTDRKYKKFVFPPVMD